MDSNPSHPIQAQQRRDETFEGVGKKNSEQRDKYIWARTGDTKQPHCRIVW